jgi:hypothetical protein
MELAQTSVYYKRAMCVPALSRLARWPCSQRQVSASCAGCGTAFTLWMTLSDAMAAIQELTMDGYSEQEALNRVAGNFREQLAAGTVVCPTCATAELVA